MLTLFDKDCHEFSKKYKSALDANILAFLERILFFSSFIIENVLGFAEKEANSLVNFKSSNF